MVISCVQKINYVELVLTGTGEEWSFCWGFCFIGQGSDTLFFVCLAFDGEGGGFISNGIHFWGRCNNHVECSHIWQQMVRWAWVDL